MPAKHPMKIRFQADADLNAEIVAGVLRREPGIDFQTADEARLRGLLDPEVLALAAQENRILVTHDRRTMPRHFADYLLHPQLRTPDLPDLLQALELSQLQKPLSILVINLILLAFR